MYIIQLNSNNSQE